MATAIVRSAKNFRNLHQRFYFHTLLTKCRPPIPSPTIADNIQHRALPLIQQVHFLIISFFPIISLIQNDKILNFKNFTFFCVIFFYRLYLLVLDSNLSWLIKDFQAPVQQLAPFNQVIQNLILKEATSLETRIRAKAILGNQFAAG